MWVNSAVSRRRVWRGSLARPLQGGLPGPRFRFCWGRGAVPRPPGCTPLASPSFNKWRLFDGGGGGRGGVGCVCVSVCTCVWLSLRAERETALPSNHVVAVVVQLLSRVWLFATPWTAAHQASLSFPISQSLLKLMSTELVMPSNHLILCHPPLLLPSIFPSLRVFSSESVLCIQWPKYWSSSFSIQPKHLTVGYRGIWGQWLLQLKDLVIFFLRFKIGFYSGSTLSLSFWRQWVVKRESMTLYSIPSVLFWCLCVELCHSKVLYWSSGSITLEWDLIWK